jgi:hypothetical protein
MMRILIGVLLLAVVLEANASAQTPDGRFHWAQGQTLYYRVQHTTSVAETVAGSKVETSSKLNLIRCWKVVGVDADGVATVEMSISAMRNEQTRPSGEVMVFDSREPEKSTPVLREQLAKVINQTLSVLRVDAMGRVVEVKQGQASRYEAELPFGLVLPGGALSAAQSWTRQYNIVLDPPLGTGEKYPSVQKFVCSKVEGSLATLTLTTELVQMPANKMEQLPLFQKLPQGEAVFDLQHGRLQALRVAINREVQGHQGEGSSYHFQSTYTEEYAE